MFFPENGKLLTFGETDEGKLGQGANVSDHHTPQEVSGISGKVIWASCGGSHTVAITGEWSGSFRAMPSSAHTQIGILGHSFIPRRYNNRSCSDHRLSPEHARFSKPQKRFTSCMEMESNNVA